MSLRWVNLNIQGDPIDNLQPFEIRDPNNNLFCKRQRQEDGNIVLMSKNATIGLMELQKQAFNPKEASQRRNKKKH